MKNLHISRKMFSIHHIILSENISTILLSWIKKAEYFWLKSNKIWLWLSDYHYRHLFWNVTRPILVWLDFISQYKYEVKSIYHRFMKLLQKMSLKFSLSLCILYYICNNLPSLEQIHSTLTFHTNKETSLALSFQCDEEILFNYLKCSFLWGEKDQTQPIFQVYTSPGF